MITYAARIAAYLWRRSSWGASDEHRLFDAVPLPATGASPLPRALVSLSDSWRQRLADTRTRALRVIREGTVVRQWDAPGDSPDRAGRLYSITKSVLSLAWGLADSEGLVPSLDQSVYAGLTPRNLLRMDSGLGFDEGLRQLNRQVLTYLHPNARQTARRARLEDPVADHFHYNDFHSLLLGVLLEEGLERSGWKPGAMIHEPVVAWIYERLLVPLGLEHPGCWVVDSSRHRFPKTESGLCLAADDVARIGILMLSEGTWQGKPLVPAAWIRDSTNPDLGWSGASAFVRYKNLAWGPWLSTGRGAYGWHWWLRPQEGERPTIFALGIHGQVLLISPRHHAVVVRLADRWALDQWWPETLLEGLDSGEL